MPVSIALSTVHVISNPIGSTKMANGRAIRFTRCSINRPGPRRRHSIIVKKPESRKNNGIRNPCTAWKNSSNQLSLSAVESTTTQNPGKNDSDACSAMPSSMANPRNASRSCQRFDEPAVAAGAGAWVGWLTVTRPSAS